MDKSLSQDHARDVYRAYAELIHRYPDRAQDKQIRHRLDQATTKEKTLVTFEAPPAAVSPTAALSIPSWTRYTRSADIKQPSGVVLPVTVADVQYGIDSGTGEVKWRMPIGFPITFRPTPISADSTRYVAHDTSKNELVLFDSTSGGILSRLPLGSVHPRIATDITLTPGRLFVVASPTENEQGLLISIRMDGDTLLWERSIHFPQPILTPPAFDHERETLLVVAEQGSMFVINQSTQTAESVLFLGHEAGSIRHRPTMTGRFLFFDQLKGTQMPSCEPS